MSGMGVIWEWRDSLTTSGKNQTLTGPSGEGTSTGQVVTWGTPWIFLLVPLK